MEHNSLKRPAFPLTTPISLPSGKSSAYGVVSRANLDVSLRAAPTDAADDKAIIGLERSKETLQKDFKDRYIQKMLIGLPYSVRENVTSIVNMTLSSAEITQKNLEISHMEITKLRSELKKKSAEMEQGSKSCDIYRERIRTLEDTLQNLKDNIETRQKFFSRNKRATDRLAATNRMLIDALDALQTTEQMKAMDATPLRPSEVLLSSENKTRSGLLRPITPQEKSGVQVPVPLIIEKGGHEKTNTGVQNDKLRESLLRVAREHYRSMKNAEVLETQVDELQGKLKACERKLRQTILELDSFRGPDASENAGNSARDGGADGASKKSKLSKRDQRMKTLLNSQAMDAVDATILLRSFIIHLSEAPPTLRVEEIAAHVVARDACKIFSVDTMTLFLVNPHDKEVLFRFTQRSASPDEFNIHESSCLVASVLQSGSILRSNNAQNFQSINLDIDTIPGVIPKRIMYIPLRDKSTGAIFGVLGFVNKHGVGHLETFAELDELFAWAYAAHVSYLLSTCQVYDRINQKSLTLDMILESSTLLYDAIADPNSLAASKNLQPHEVLSMLETACRTVLRCSKVKAFLVSSYLKMERDRIIFLDSYDNISVSSAFSANVNSALTSSGIAGHVVRSKSVHLIENDELDVDVILNPSIDLEPPNGFMMTFPVMNLHGEVMACLQFVPGPGSPPLSCAPEHKDEVVCFPQAALWLVHQLAPPLEYILRQVGRPASRPSSTPQAMVRKASFNFDSTKSPFFDSAPVRVSNDSSVVELAKLTIREDSYFEEVEDSSTLVSLITGPTGVANKDSIDKLNLELDRVRKELSDAKAKLLENEQHALFNEKDQKKFDDIVKQQRVENETLRESIQRLQEQIAMEKAAVEKTLTSKDDKSATVASYEFKLQALEANHVKLVDDLKAQHSQTTTALEQQLGDHSTRYNQIAAELAVVKDTLSGTEKSRLLADDRNVALAAEVDSLRANCSRMKYDNDQHLNKQAELQATVKQQESVIAIMQEQLMKFAGDSLKEIDAAIRKNDIKPSTKSPRVSPRSGPPKTPPPNKSGASEKTPKSTLVGQESAQGSLGPWVEQKDSYGNVYYYNTQTQETSWTLPDASGSDPTQQAVRQGDWLQQFDENNNEYWLNEATGESVWELPDASGYGAVAGSQQPSIYSTSASAGGYTIDL